VRARYRLHGEKGVVEQVVYWIDCPNGDVMSIACSGPESVDATLPVVEEFVGKLRFLPAAGAETRDVPARDGQETAGADLALPNVPMPGAGAASDTRAEH